MYVSKAKILVVFLIICSVLYKAQVESKIDKDINSYQMRRIFNEIRELPDFPDDYNTQEYAKVYLKNFLDILQDDINTDVSKYIEEGYYKSKIENNKEAFIQDMKKNVIMVNSVNNYQDIGFVTEYLNKDGHRTIAFDILVIEKGLTYPKGFESLKERDDPDKSKRIDIHVIEYSPYNFKIIFPDKTVLEEEF